MGCSRWGEHRSYSCSEPKGLCSQCIPSFSGAPSLPGHEPSEDSASISLLPASPLATPDPVHRDSSQPSPTICSAPGPVLPISPHRSNTPDSPYLSCTPSPPSLGQVPSPHQAHNTKPQKLNLEFKEQGSTPNKQQCSPETRTKRDQEPCAVWVSISSITREDSWEDLD